MNSIKELISSKAFQMGVIAGVSGTISAFVTFRITKKRLDLEYREVIDKEILEARKFYSALNKRDAYASPELVMKEVGLDNAVKALNNYQGVASVAESEDPIVEEKEHRTMRPISPLSEDRDTTVPYIITVEEFMEASDPDGRSQITLTYYADDDVLSDEKDQPVDDVDYTIGSENLTHFGEGSGDGRVVYIRNDHIDVDFEVILHQGNYAELVHGITKEPRRRAKKFRGDDG